MAKKNNKSAISERVVAEPGRTVLDWPIHAGVVDRVLGRVDEKLQRKRRRRASVVSVLSAMALAVFLGVVPWVRDTATFSTPPAQRSIVMLADGSRAELNAQTRIRTDFRYGWRHVRLEQGEAFFTVTKDPSHPFLVTTPHGTVRVTGTMFNVRLSAGAAPEVTLLEGKVSFEASGAAPVALAPGAQLSIDGATPRVHMLAANDLENLVIWREGRLSLDGLTLAEAAARLARYHGTTIVVAPEVAALRPGGAVRIENLGSVLEVLQDILPIRAERRDDGSVHLEARKDFSR